MAFVVEDGSGIADANSLASVEDVSAYLTSRNKGEAWDDLDTEVAQAACVSATDYFEAVWGQLLSGSRVSGTQALSLPRTGMMLNGFEVEDDVVPTLVINVIAELADRAKDGPLVADISAGTGAVIESSKTVGPITKTTKYSEATARSNTSYTAVGLMLRPLLTGGGSSGGIAIR